MKVLLCHNFYQRPGGEDVVYRNEGALLEAHGHEVIRYERHNSEIKNVSKMSLLRSTLWNEETVAEVAQIIEQQRPDVLHAHNTFPLMSPSLYTAAKRRGVAVVQTLHNYRIVCPNAQLFRDNKACQDCVSLPFAVPGIAHRCYRDNHAASSMVATMSAYHRLRGTWQNTIDQYISMTSFAKDIFVKGGLPADKITVKPHFVEGAPEPGEGAGNYVIFVGRLSEEKGLRWLIEAWKQVPNAIELKILGDGPLAAFVQSASEEDPRIKWMGHQPASEVLRLIGDAQCLIMPSLWYETFGLCIAEAFAKGTPVIASDLGVMAELVKHDENGWLVTPGDVDGLTKTLVGALHEGEKKAFMRKTARAEYETRFSAEKNHQLLLEVYDRALKNAKGKRDLAA